MNPVTAKISNDFNAHRPASADVLEQHENPFADNESICESDDDRSSESAADDGDSDSEPESPLRTHCHILQENSRRNGGDGFGLETANSVFSAQDAVTAQDFESPFSDTLSDDDSDSWSLRSPISPVKGSLSDSESGSDSDSGSDDEDEADDTCPHCNFLPSKPYAFRPSQTPPPRSTPTRSILSPPLPPPTTPKPLYRRLTLKPTKTPSPLPPPRPTVRFTTSQTKHFSPTAPTHHITCIPHVPHPPVDTPSRLREHFLHHRRRRTNAHASVQVHFRRVAAAAADSTGRPGQRVRVLGLGAEAALEEVVAPFKMKMDGAATLDELLDVVRELWPGLPERGVVGGGGGERDGPPVWPLRWVRFRLMEVGEGKGKGELVDSKEQARSGGLKRWLPFADAEGNVRWWEEERLVLEYARLLRTWRRVEEERVMGLKRKENRREIGGLIRRVLSVMKGEESGETLRRRFAKGKVTPVVELLWE